MAASNKTSPIVAFGKVQVARLSLAEANALIQQQKQQTQDGRSPLKTFSGTPPNVWVLTMRDGQNRQNPAWLASMGAALDYVEREAAGKPGVLITRGEFKFYSTGIDLDLMSKEPEQARGFLPRLQALLVRLLTYPLYTIALINGHCFAGALMFAMAHDFRYMRPGRSLFSLPAIRLGIVLPPGFFAMLRAKVGDGRVVRRVALEGDRFTAEEALELGLIDGLAAGDHMQETCELRALGLLQKCADGDSLARTKQAVYHDVLATMQLTASEDEARVPEYGKARSRL